MSHTSQRSGQYHSIPNPAFAAHPRHTPPRQPSSSLHTDNRMPFTGSSRAHLALDSSPTQFPSHRISQKALSSSSLSPIASVTDKFSLHPDPQTWGSDLHYTEPDDHLHNPEQLESGSGIGNICSKRALSNLGCLLLLALGILALFVGYPLLTFMQSTKMRTFGGFNIGGINASGQIPSMTGNYGLIDLDTPQDVYMKPSYDGKGELELVFSDEFNVDGRSFYPGDDPYWEAVDLHYWGTNNMEWYSPDQVTTNSGALEITLARKPSHDLDYEGGMLSTWNKFCFTGGLIESAVTLPGVNNVVGLWPALWTMGNLGRAGYGASLEGMWPYTYDSCDVGTVANQSVNGLPVAATIDGDRSANDELSYLPGQRLSRCTCPGGSHPGPIHSDGTYVGRAAPEIDVFEAQVTGEPLKGEVSQSGQWAPFNAKYEWFNTTETLKIADPSISFLNTYKGAAFQQATSVVSETNHNCYESGGTKCFSVYGFEYKPGFDDAYIIWINDGKFAWSMTAAGMAADSRVEIGPRPIPQEPMYIIANLGMSRNFGEVDLEHLVFPSTMRVDWIRVYQYKDQINIGCDPKEFPTKAYIEQYIEAYTNPNLTTWIDDYKQPFPKNRFLGEC